MQLWKSKMKVGETLPFLVLSCLLLPIIVTAQQSPPPWAEFPFLEGPPRDEVAIEPSRDSVIIHMEEEIAGDVYIAKLNYYGSGQPNVRIPFTVGTPRYLGAIVRQDDEIDSDDPNAWYLVITQRQDYESEGMQRYIFFVEIIEGNIEYRAEVFLLIVNIDDNPPIIHVVDTCEIPELYVGMTNCTYRVSDIDGDISIVAMTFTMEGRRNEDELFAINEERFNHTRYEMQITLQTVRELDYDISAMHILTITAFDSLPNNSSQTIAVQVEDVPNMPPRWVSIFAVQQFDEKTTQNFTVRAIDGDTQINKDIKYRLYKNESYTFFEIDENTGLLTVDEIDRDALKQEVFPFSISAYKHDNITWETLFSVVIIVDDVNDNSPEPLNDNFHISIEEETFLSLAFADEIVIEDIDLASNAQYNVELLDVYPPGAKDAFMIIPSEGYQRQTFQITIVRAQLLDFEMLEWQTVQLQIKAQEIMDPEHVGFVNVTINLINWNDEVPIFEEEFYEAVFNETEGRGFEVATVIAKDRDIDDKVHHSIMGSASSILSIDTLTGVITVSADNAFDYQRQNEIIVQVRAVDTLGDGPYHTVFAQLTINLMDVNNKQPQINLPRNTPLVEENVPDGHVINEGITGLDPDSTANVTYSINWENSYASKQGRAAERGEYVGCVDILTVYEDIEDLGNARGILVARQIREGVTIDFEMFEVLYLAIKLTDHNQEIGDDFSESMMVIMIEDLNDNPPVWVEGTLEEVRIVREMADAGVIIGSVQATDIDGPLYNNVTYWLFTSEDTPENLVSIHPITGQLSVQTGRAIDADTPPRHHLFYTINATDCCFYEAQCGLDPNCFNTLGKIEINIVDTNNKIPFTRDGEYDVEYPIYENATSGTDIGNILGGDWDRDEIYHQVAYGINYREHQSLRNFFAIEELTGRLYVELLNDQVLDRDRGITFHDIYIILTDNHLLEGDRTINTNFTQVRVILLDVNDNAPVLPLPSRLSWSISEDLANGVQLEPLIYAPDIDEPDTDNSRVNYQILSLNIVDRELDHPDDLFGMLNPDNVTGHLITMQDLKGFWGTWDIWIRAHDYGIPEMSTNETYQIIVNPYNFHDPVFTFPVREGQVILLGKEMSVPNVVLYYANNIRFDNIHATDEDGLSAGIVTFEVLGDDDARDHFTIQNEGVNTGTLILTRELSDDLTTFEVTIRATDQGTDPGPRITDIAVTIRFVTTQGDPTFEQSNVQTAFTEFDAGLQEMQQLPLAVDPKNTDCTDLCSSVFYYIIDGDSRDMFQLDRDNNILRLTRELNRSVAIQHTLRVVASNSANQPEAVPNFASILNVAIEVKDSDPKPRFTATEYTGGITITDPIDKEILTVHATHSENEEITYDILWDTMVTDPSLVSVASTAVRINQNTGAIMLNFQQQASMTGMLEFKVSATDVSEREDEASVKIYLVADDNRVIFRFFNSLTEVEQEKEFIESTVSHWFELICNVDWIVRSNHADGTALEDTTDARAHFIDNNVAVDASVIELKRSDITLMRSLREALRNRNLNLEDVNTGASTSDSSSLDSVLLIILGILAAIFAVLCVMIIVFYCITTRRLKRRLDGLSETKYDAKEIMDTSHGDGNDPASGEAPRRHTLAPPGLVPGTNRHALEGSNPVWNEAIKAPDFDALSDSSGDSDLIGIEDDPQFRYFNPEIDEAIDRANNIEGVMNPAFDQSAFAPRHRPPL